MIPTDDFNVHLPHCEYVRPHDVCDGAGVVDRWAILKVEDAFIPGTNETNESM